MAEIVQSSSMNRIKLGKILPLETPLSVHMFTSYYCDFKCIYCVHSLSEKEFLDIFKQKGFMSIDTFKNAIDGMKKFNQKLKVLSFDGQGEPLLNKNLPEMISYAKKANIAERIELVTNGNSITNEKADAIVAAGLDRIRISIQGMNSEKYKEISNVDIDFEEYKKNIKYLYDNKKQLSIYIKIIDVAIDGEEQDFYNMFGDRCDNIAVEHMVPTADKVDYSQYKGDYDISQQGYEHKKIITCPYPLYMMIVEPNGDVRSCCATRHPINLGNVNENTLYNIWYGDELREFWKLQLAEDGRFKNLVCKECTNPDYGVQPGDDIDNYAREILSRMEENK